uniref:Uncharacterized protein n=1 Tax=Rhizophora mucronata TaxID=61149 RepID=A0A2P2NSB7_RHIMU
MSLQLLMTSLSVLALATSDQIPEFNMKVDDWVHTDFCLDTSCVVLSVITST